MGMNSTKRYQKYISLFHCFAVTFYDLVNSLLRPIGNIDKSGHFLSSKLTALVLSLENVIG